MVESSQPPAVESILPIYLSTPVCNSIVATVRNLFIIQEEPGIQCLPCSSQIINENEMLSEIHIM